MFSIKNGVWLPFFLTRGTTSFCTLKLRSHERERHCCDAAKKNWWFGKHDDELRVKPRKSYDQWSFNCHCWLCIWIYITHIWDCWVFVKVYIIYPFMYHIQVNTCVPFNCFIAILKSRKGPAGVAWSGSRNRCRVPCRRDSDGSDDPKSVFLGLHKMVPPR